MSNPWELSNIDLSQTRRDVNFQSVTPGIHNCRVKEAKVEKSGKSEFWGLAVTFHVEEIGKDVNEWIAYYHPDHGKDEKITNNCEQGRAKMKSILTHGGFHDPNRPRGVDDYVGLRLSVQMDYEYKKDKHGKPLLDKDGNKIRATWHDPKTGEERPSGCKPVRWGAYGPLKNGQDGNPAVIIDQKYNDNGSGTPVAPPLPTSSYDGDLIPDEPI